MMTVQKAYEVMQENCDIEVGDTVRVLRKVYGREMGWGTSWTSNMDQCVGKTFTVKKVDGMSGFNLGTKELCGVDYWYPFFVLELVSKAKKVIKVVKYYDEKGTDITERISQQTKSNLDDSQ